MEHEAFVARRVNPLADDGHVMCNLAGIEFGRANLSRDDVHGKSVIEVGSRDVNGSLRPVVEALCPDSYIGVDLTEGRGVDEICDATRLLNRFGHEAFDLLVCTELLEHVRDWRGAVHNFKCVLKPNGILLISTRSKGFGYHGYPFDFWRYEISDVEGIFSDLELMVVEKDPSMPGVFLKARKPEGFAENNLSDHLLYSVIKGGRVADVTRLDICRARVWYGAQQCIVRVLPEAMKRRLRGTE